MSRAPMSRSRKRSIAIVIAAAIVVAGGAVASVSVANAVAAETARQCSAALKDSAAAFSTVSSSIARAAAALDAVASTALPGTEGWETTRYANRPARAEVKASPAAGAAKPARPSGADLIGAVSTGRDALAKAKRATTCADREAAVAITAATRASNTAAEVLDREVAALTGDFADFQAEERTRLAAEAEAARKRAEDAARKKAEEAAAEEAARQAAAEQAARGGDSDGSTGSGDSDGSVPQQPSGGSGGGSVGGGLGGSVGVGSGDNNGWCQKSNGMGGTIRYRC